jgi:hypothetical protein
VSRLLLQGWMLFAAVLLTAAVIGCSEPAAAPPADAPWLDPKQQIQLLNQNDNRLRILAARNLGRLGERAAEAIPHLERMAADSDPKVSQNAREALEKIRAATGQSTE